MSNFLSSSIGKKVIMSLSGLFLVMFLLVHLVLNSLLMFDKSGDLFNAGAHFMVTNPFIKILEPVLALGFIIHIIWSSVITVQNQRARPVKYARHSPGNSSSWPSRNMYILGGLVFVFLVIHMYNFFWKMKFAGDPLLTHVHVNGQEMENAYALVATLFKTSLPYCIFYVAGAILLGMHLAHGFWSSFQSVGLNNRIWEKRLKIVAHMVATFFTVGYSIIPIYFQIF